MKVKKLLLARPRGFCAGVVRAIDVVNVALKLYKAPIYVRKEIIHNSHVVEAFKAQGVIFVEELDEVPDGTTVIFSAHGLPPEVRTRAAAKQLKVIDATCPLVTKVHQEAVRFAQEGLWIIMVGEEGHDEVVGTMGEVPDHITRIGSVEEAERVYIPDPEKVGIITQTTLSIDDTQEILNTLRRRFPKLVVPSRDDICYATQNRQMAIKILARAADLVLVLGSDNSHNSNRLREMAESTGVRAYLIDDVSEIDTAWLKDGQCVAITAGASAPEQLIQEVVEYFKTIGVDEIEEIGATKEEVHFALPQELLREIPGIVTPK
jgi:4-hydroxy-3-methylbut-2-en-1-yl diphosphate reductase